MYIDMFVHKHTFVSDALAYSVFGLSVKGSLWGSLWETGRQGICDQALPSPTILATQARHFGHGIVDFGHAVANFGHA